MSPECGKEIERMTCSNRVFGCTEYSTGDGAVEGIPVLPCQSVCTDFYFICKNEMDLYISVALSNVAEASDIPSCGLPPNGFGTLGRDTYGGRLIGGGAYIDIAGNKGETRFSDGVSTYVDREGTPHAQTSKVAPASLDIELGSEVSCNHPISLIKTRVCETLGVLTQCIPQRSMSP